MDLDDFVPEFTQEELDANAEADDLLYDHIEWEKMPQTVKKRIWTRKMICIKESQGNSLELVDGFSFDSDSKIKLYN